ncbi:MAG: hypothetical protein M3N43_01780 [Actinomycetota bacterium]|nr:hypothetical protein [Actinomycetota bacterium]
MESTQLAKQFTGGGGVDQATMILRMGEVKNVYVQEGKVDITLGGESTELIPRVAHMSNFQPNAGDYIWVSVNGPDLLVVDRTSLDGPSVISRSTSAITYETSTRTSTVWGDLATEGPSTNTFVSPSGRCLVGVGGYVSNDSAASGAAIGFEITPHYPPVEAAPANRHYGFVPTTYTLPPDFSRAFVSTRGGAGRQVGGTRSVWLEGIPSGSYKFTAKYCAIGGGTARFQYRNLDVVPF